MLPFRHPTTTFVLDDDTLFLESFGYSFGRSLVCRTEKFPPAAIDCVSADARRLGRLLDVFGPVHGRTDAENGDFAPCLLRLHRHPFAAIADDPHRTATISVVVVDYAMPSMSGLDVCRAIKDTPAKKILLTGKAGDDTAVAAFNEGLIDCFLVKQDPHLIERLPAEIRRLEVEFFRALARPINIAAHASALGFLNDSGLASHLQSEFVRHRTVEHYLWDNPPGFLTVDADDRRRQFIVYDGETMRAQCEVAVEADAPRGLVSLLAEGKSIVRFPTSSGFYVEQFAAEWQNYVLPARQVSGTQWHVAISDVARSLPMWAIE